MPSFERLASTLGLAIGLCGAAAACAEDVTPPSAPVSQEWIAESERALAELRGGLDGGNRALASVAGAVAENRVGDGSPTGAVSLSDAAVSDIRGIYLATFNTGNNASVQAVLNVIIDLD